MSENNTPALPTEPCARRCAPPKRPVAGAGDRRRAAGGVLAWQMGWLERLGGGRPAEEDLGQPIGAQVPRTPTRRVPTVTCASPTR